MEVRSLKPAGSASAAQPGASGPRRQSLAFPRLGPPGRLTCGDRGLHRRACQVSAGPRDLSQEKRLPRLKNTLSQRARRLPRPFPGPSFSFLFFSKITSNCTEGLSLSFPKPSPPNLPDRAGGRARERGSRTRASERTHRGGSEGTSAPWPGPSCRSKTGRGCLDRRC